MFRLHITSRLMLIINESVKVFVPSITEYVSEVACCASVTPACLLSISNLLSLLCCKTDYLFCYISINVILLLKATVCCTDFHKESWCWKRLQELHHTASNTSAVVLFVALTPCIEAWCWHDSPVPVMSSGRIHTCTLDFQTDTMYMKMHKPNLT